MKNGVLTWLKKACISFSKFNGFIVIKSAMTSKCAPSCFIINLLHVFGCSNYVIKLEGEDQDVLEFVQHALMQMEA